MDYQKIRDGQNGESEYLWTMPLDVIPAKKNQDKIRGCLIGGAAGDALGYAVEFVRENYIFSKFGPRGITEYKLHGGLARISDDTQMTMFTANGLLRGAALAGDAAGCKNYCHHIAAAYRDWYKTQYEPIELCNRKFINSWLMYVPDLFSARAPGNTCLSAISEGCGGRVEYPINNSKGCGGVMRVAPIGLFFAGSGMAPLCVDLLGADAAAATHGHEMGYIPAALLAHIIRLVAGSDRISLKEAVLSGMEAMERLFPEAKNLPAFLELIGRAVELAESETNDLEAIHELGEGWVGDEALAIAVYCAVKYQDDFDKAMIAAVNHNGDSDSTGAIAGNILGAYLGLSRIPEKYLKNLELKEELLELADDLYRGVPDGTDPGYETKWRMKYVDVTWRA